jgi:hypothetical protein
VLSKYSAAAQSLNLLHSVTTVLHTLHFCRHTLTLLHAPPTLPLRPETSRLVPLSPLGRLRTDHLPRHSRTHL